MTFPEPTAVYVVKPHQVLLTRVVLFMVKLTLAVCLGVVLLVPFLIGILGVGIWKGFHEPQQPTEGRDDALLAQHFTTRGRWDK